VPKLPRVEYEITYDDFGCSGSSQNPELIIDDDMQDLNQDTQDTTMINNSVWNNQITYTSETRPMGNLDHIFEAKMKVRATKFHMKPIDKTQYEPEHLQKQLDLETLTVTLQEEAANAKQAHQDQGGIYGLKVYKRTTSKEANQEGRYRRLIKEIEEMAQTYGVELDHAFELFASVSCSKSHFKNLLEK